MAQRIVRRSFGRVGGGTRRQTLWLASTAETGVSGLAANTIVFDQSLTTAEKARRPFTVVRTRGRLWVQSDQASGNEEPLGALGFAVVSDQAVTIGVTALPAPILDQASDLWFVWEPWAASVKVATAASIMQGFSEYAIDSKAMRKVEEGQDIVVMLQNNSAAHGMQYILEFRLLIKTH